MSQPAQTMQRSASPVVRGAAETLARAPVAAAAGRWRWTVSRHLQSLRDLLADGSDADTWAAARGGAELRRRRELMARTALLCRRVLEVDDPATLRDELARLLTDVDHHLQRLRDLAWDDAGLDLGGSE